jgi:hypothetical protein
VLRICQGGGASRMGRSSQTPFCAWSEFPLRRTARTLRPNFQLARAALVLASFFLAAQVRAAEDDIQIFNLGPHVAVFYVPKSWMQHGSFTAYAPPRTMVDKPQSAPIDARSLSIHLQFTPGQLGPFERRDLPDFIEIISEVGPDRGLFEMYQHSMDQAAPLQADATGFVRIATGFPKPGERPVWERYLYKGYQNELGEPLLVEASNDTLYPSTVTINLRPDVRFMYRFENRKFPRSTWWDLHQRVIAFLGYLQAAK